MSEPNDTRDKEREEGAVGTVGAEQEGAVTEKGAGSDDAKSPSAREAVETRDGGGPGAPGAAAPAGSPSGEASGRAQDQNVPRSGEAVEAAGAVDEEADILRNELTQLQEKLQESRREAEEFRDRYLRSRADLENFRRRSADDVERAREAGLDSAVLAVLTVFDDLGRALQAAESSEDPASIVPGVRAVKQSLERSLENLGIRPIGRRGEPFDPNEHEALTAVPPTGDAEPGTIADVFQAGFKRGERLVRPARVVVYKEPD